MITGQALVKIYGPYCVAVLLDKGFIEELPRERKKRAKYKVPLGLPDLEEYKVMLKEKYSITIEDLFEGAKSDIEELQSEMEDWASNLESSSLSNTNKCSEVRSAADTLSSLNWPELETWPEFKVLSLPDLSYRTGRAHRAGIAAAELTAVEEALTTYKDENDKTMTPDRQTEIQEFADSCSEVSSDVGNVDFPGMY